MFYRIIVCSHQRALPPQLERDLLEIRIRARPHDDVADLRAPGEAELADAGVVGDGLMLKTNFFFAFPMRLYKSTKK